MAEDNLILATTDAGRNIIRLSFVGDIGVDQARRDEKAISAALMAARPGFSLFTDLSRLRSMDVDCLPYITRIMELAKSQGVARVVRNIPDPLKDIGFNIMSLFHYPRGLPIITCENATEADRALN